MQSKTLTLTLETAKKAYKTADPELKAILEENFGKSTLSDNPLDLIQSLDDVYDMCDVERGFVPLDAEDDDDRSTNADFIIKLITRAYNKGEKLDWSKTTQPKYYLYFEWVQGEWQLDAVHDLHNCALLGAGHYFASEQAARDAYKKFKHMWDSYLPKW